jgi:hypothetical protein
MLVVVFFLTSVISVATGSTSLITAGELVRFSLVSLQRIDFLPYHLTHSRVHSAALLSFSNW